MQSVTRFFTNINNIIPILLFFFLSPGLILTLPPSDNGVFFSGQSNRWAIFIHTLVFSLVLLVSKRFLGGVGGGLGM